jgi:hypothetical protein
LNVLILNVIALNMVVMSAIMLNVVMLNVAMLSATVPQKVLKCQNFQKTLFLFFHFIFIFSRLEYFMKRASFDAFVKKEGFIVRRKSYKTFFGLVTRRQNKLVRFTLGGVSILQ